MVQCVLQSKKYSTCLGDKIWWWNAQRNTKARSSNPIWEQNMGSGGNIKEEFLEDLDPLQVVSSNI